MPRTSDSIDVNVEVDFQEEVVLKEIRKRMDEGSESTLEAIRKLLIDTITRGGPGPSDPHDPWKAHGDEMIESLETRNVKVVQGPDSMAVIGQIGFQTKIAYILEVGTEDMAPRPLLQQVSVENKRLIWEAWKQGAI